ncbi:MAG: peptide-methionine (S)-S-oxide reductase MsrA [Anaerolineales bacterium]|nr:peptide-methionine (S)-S-oxide reductase MsrA [Anaerolineales bacterium]
MSQHTSLEKEITTLGGGCFWCLDPIFDELKGVEEVVVGYAGGKVANPSYQLVCTGTSGHAEVVQITFNPQIISYRELLQIFFSIHDPTTPNRQGADVGPQYRSIIFYHNETQKVTAEKVIQEFDAEGVWDAPIVTEVAAFSAFYEAEDYHQKYFEKNPGQGYCRVVIAPKVAKFRVQYQQKLQR